MWTCDCIWSGQLRARSLLWLAITIVSPVALMAFVIRFLLLLLHSMFGSCRWFSLYLTVSFVNFLHSSLLNAFPLICYWFLELYIQLQELNCTRTKMRKSNSLYFLFYSLSLSLSLSRFPSLPMCIIFANVDWTLFLSLSLILDVFSLCFACLRFFVLYCVLIQTFAFFSRVIPFNYRFLSCVPSSISI